MCSGVEQGSWLTWLLRMQYTGCLVVVAQLSEWCDSFVCAVCRAVVQGMQSNKLHRQQKQQQQSYKCIAWILQCSLSMVHQIRTCCVLCCFTGELCCDL